MVSDLLTPGGRLQYPNHAAEEGFLTAGVPRRFATEYLEYGKDKYWPGEDMARQTTQVAIPIFNYVFPGCVAVFMFDNASNHCLC